MSVGSVHLESNHRWMGIMSRTEVLSVETPPSILIDYDSRRDTVFPLLIQCCPDFNLPVLHNGLSF